MAMSERPRRVITRRDEVKFIAALYMVVDTSDGRGPLSYTQGERQIIPGLEEELSGLTDKERELLTKFDPAKGWSAERYGRMASVAIARGLSASSVSASCSTAARASKSPRSRALPYWYSARSRARRTARPSPCPFVPMSLACPFTPLMSTCPGL